MRHRDLRVTVLEKEKTLAYHQTGHNSGVIHTGIYYTPGSLKAKLCVEGCKLIYQYCDQHNIPYKKCGKIIVAVDENELPRLEALYKRGLENQVKGLRMIEADEIKEIEPFCRGLKAIHSPETGIVDYGCVARSFAESFKEMGGEVHTGAEVIDFSFDKDAVTVHIKGGSSFVGHYVLTCAGLYSDKIASKSGCSHEPQIIPFRGEYLLLKREKEHFVRGNIYPVPDPQFPFLGVHFTPRIDGGIWLGPNAVLGFAREGYKLWNINLKELVHSLTYRGLQKLARKHWYYGLKEFYQSLFLRAQVHQLQKYVPDVTIDDVIR
jgi:2-hydroxyglutarate dehydrogenase